MAGEAVEVVRRLYDAVARGDDEEVIALYDPDVEFDGSRSRWFEMFGGDALWSGHEGLREFFRLYYETWERLEHEIDDALEVGDRVVTVVTARGRGRASGAEVEWRGNTGLFTVRDGRIVHIAWFSSREEALEAARASGP
jgi:ketosteroid isomerase-like protein